jgi:hypothetical protein
VWEAVGSYYTPLSEKVKMQDHIVGKLAFNFTFSNPPSILDVSFLFLLAIDSMFITNLQSKAGHAANTLQMVYS